MRVISITGNYSATIYDKLILVNATSGAITVTLPAPADAGNAVIEVKKTDSSVNAVTISHPTATIDGAASKLLSYQYDALTVGCNGISFFII
jgi:hypothetical protein